MHHGRILIAVGIATLLPGTVATAQNGTPINTGSANPLTIAVYGDAPYGTTPTDTTQLEKTAAFIASINGDPKVDLVFHVGDIHSGKQYCTEAYDRTVYDLWTMFKNPLIYTPGDNEWADCHKAAEGGHVYLDAPINSQPVDYADGDPLQNLDLVRSIFFTMPGYSLGGRKKQVLTQATAYDPAHPEDAAFVENVMWEQSRVLFVTVNIPGGSNNDADPWFGVSSARQTAERTGRTDADLRWLDAAFARAQQDGVEAVVIVAQADMWDLDGKAPSHLTNYDPLVSNVGAHTLVFGRPVLMFNGDSHEFVSDNPLAISSPLHALHPVGDVPNFHRIVVHGSTEPLEWLRLTITPGTTGSGPNSFGPFAWQRINPLP
jgi:hypothetical protein